MSEPGPPSRSLSLSLSLSLPPSLFLSLLFLSPSLPLSDFSAARRKAGFKQASLGTVVVTVRVVRTVRAILCGKAAGPPQAAAAAPGAASCRAGTAPRSCSISELSAAPAVTRCGLARTALTRIIPARAVQLEAIRAGVAEAGGGGVCRRAFALAGPGAVAPLRGGCAPEKRRRRVGHPPRERRRETRSGGDGVWRLRLR